MIFIELLRSINAWWVFLLSAMLSFVNGYMWILKAPDGYFIELMTKAPWYRNRLLIHCGLFLSNFVLAILSR
jgi:hypothetical protein